MLYQAAFAITGTDKVQTGHHITKNWDGRPYPED